MEFNEGIEVIAFWDPADTKGKIERMDTFLGNTENVLLIDADPNGFLTDMYATTKPTMAFREEERKKLDRSVWSADMSERSTDGSTLYNLIRSLNGIIGWKESLSNMFIGLPVQVYDFGELQPYKRIIRSSPELSCNMNHYLPGELKDRLTHIINTACKRHHIKTVAIDVGSTMTPLARTLCDLATYISVPKDIYHVARYTQIDSDDRVSTPAYAMIDFAHKLTEATI